MPRLLLASLALVLLLPIDARADVPAPPMQLPGEVTASANETWLLGTKARVPGGRQVLPNVVEVPAARARGIARRLGARLTFAEPNRPRAYAQGVGEDPLTPLSQWRRNVINPALTPPPVSGRSPLLALVDAKAGVDLPEFRGQRVRSPGKGKVKIAHGTETLGVAVAPVNGVGIVGAYPGARAANFALPAKRIRCADSARGIRRAVRADARVVSMSYGSSAFCQAEYEALQLATKRGISLVAASGNERKRGNPYEFPASLPHVVTVGASNPDNKPTFFSNSSGALDLVAPGVGILAPLPRRLDRSDDLRDGYEVVAGTSFSTPIVAAAALWLRTARPDLSFDQTTTVLRLSADDLGPQGYDVRTGYGKLNLERALQTPTPSRDRGEPNDDFRYVDGRAFRHPAKPIWTGARPGGVLASVDLLEDPIDVYRIRVPRRSAATITLKPATGNANLYVFRGGSPTVRSLKGAVARSLHKGTRRDRVRIRNRAGRPRKAFVVVYQRGKRPSNTAYGLQVTGGG